jgi:hypothetical protein
VASDEPNPSLDSEVPMTPGLFWVNCSASPVSRPVPSL